MNSGEALAVIERQDAAQALMPVLRVEQAVERHQAVVTFVKTIMQENHDFGKIPGTDKSTLLKPGAEKLTTFFGLSKRFHLTEKVEDWSGADHGGESFFYYLYRCALYNGDLLIAESDGSCNSFESKYRWRKAERVCPACGVAAIIKGKAEFGGGWICFKKKDGCGAKFSDGSSEIEDQQVGRVPNPDVCDLVNTIQKMAQKRAFIAATLLAVNASEFFTQDVEDMAVDAFDGEDRSPAPQRKAQRPAAQAPQSTAKSPEEKALDELLFAYCIKQKGDKTGKVFFDNVYAKKSLDKKREEANSLGLVVAAPAAPIPQPASALARDVVEGELIEDEPAEAVRDPRPKTLGELVTPKQLWMIRNLGRELGLDVEEESRKQFHCNLEEVSNRAADSLIKYLKAMSQEGAAPTPIPIRQEIENLLVKLRDLGCAPDEVNAKIRNIARGVYAVDEIADEHLPKVKQMLGNYVAMADQAAVEMARDFKPKEKK